MGNAAPSANGTPPADARGTALLCLRRGYAPLPLPCPGKKPALEDWPSLRLTPDDLDAHFPAGKRVNVGVLNGDPSGGLVDVDLDCPEARRAAPLLMPDTDMVTGRASAPDSHYWYVVEDPPKKAGDGYDDPTDGRHLMEFRSTGGQTVLPPSVYPAEPDKGHPQPEPCVWHRAGLPARVNRAELLAAVVAVAAAALLGRHWPARNRHNAALALAGGLLRAGWSAEKVETFVLAICAAANDEQPDDRARAVRDTAEAIDAGDQTTGWPTLARLLGAHGEVLVRTARRWLGVRILSPGSEHGRRGSEGSGVGRHSPPPPWVPFPTEHLPTAVGKFVDTVAAAMRCDPANVALPALGVCGGMIGTTRALRIKRSWVEPATVWSAVVSDSGTIKTPPYKRAVAPVVALQAEHMKAYREKLERYRAELREYERARKAAKGEDPGDPPAEPACTRVYARDTTMEALGAILNDNRARMLVGRDELSGWLSSFNQYKAKGGSDQANWLEVHGIGTVCIDRKTGVPRNMYIPGVTVSVCGGIQPGVLRAALSRQHLDAGVPARLLFAMPPRKPKEWTEDDIDEEVEKKYQGLVRGLAGLQPGADDAGDPEPVLVRMTAEAKAEWVRFYARFAGRQAEVDGDLAAAFSKIEGYAARLALLHHVCEEVAAGRDGTAEVTAESVRAGIALAEWFAAEAGRVYRMLGQDEAAAETDKLVEAVARLAARFGGRLTAKQLQNSNSRKYRSAADAEAALESLVALGVGGWEDGDPPPGGGHSPRYFVPTSDPSDPRPPADGDGQGDNDGGASDGRSDPRRPPPGPPEGPPTPSPSRNGVYARDGRKRPQRGSEGSEVGSRTRAPTGGGRGDAGVGDAPDEGRNGPGPRVGAADGADTLDGDTSFDFGANVPADPPAQDDEIYPAPGNSPSPGDGPDFVAPAQQSLPATDDQGGCRGAATIESPPAAAPGYILVTDPAGLAAVVAAVGSSGGAVGLDCETTGLDPRSAEVRLLQVAAPAGTFVIDLSFRHSQVRPSHLGPLFAALAGAEVVGHNLQFDLRFLAPLGFAPGRCFDTMLASQVLHAGGRTAAGGRLRHTLEAAAERELGRTPDKAHQKADWCKPLTPGMLAYAAADAAVLPLLAEALKVKLAAAGLTDTAALEMRALPGVAWAGPVVVDAPAWTAAALAAEGEKDRLAGEMDALVPNPAGLTGGWGWTRRADVLAAFAAAGVGLPDTKDETLAGVDHPLGVLFRAWRAADTRVKGFGRRWLAKNARGGRVLPSWQQIGSDETAVDTGRMSCSGPNLQQLPNDPVYRLCFAARPGHVLVKADYSQVELRIAARVADERLMLDAYRDGRDLHTLTAARMLGKAEADVTKADRQLAKAANFGLLYGMGRRKLAAYALAGFGVRLSEAEAGRHRRAFLAAYPALRRWQERVGGRVEESFRKDPGSVIESRTLGGRRRLIPVAVRPPARPAYPNRTAALNFPVQGTGADGLKAAIGLLWERRAECPAAVPVIFCHDEIVIEAPAADATAAAAWLKRAMVDGMAPLIAPVPVEVDVSVGPTWGG